MGVGVVKRESVWEYGSQANAQIMAHRRICVPMFHYHTPYGILLLCHSPHVTLCCQFALSDSFMQLLIQFYAASYSSDLMFKEITQKEA